MKKKAVKGFFVVIIKQCDDTMFGTDFHYTPWCIADNKYCRFTRTDKIRKFSTYLKAQEYISTTTSNAHDRQLEIAYLTTLLYGDDEKNFNLLKNWIQISGEQDAQDFDELHRASKRTDREYDFHGVFDWDSTEFHSIFQSATPKSTLKN